jgi:molecular chaperone Hsp33
VFQDYLFYATDVEVRYAYRLLNISALVESARQMHGLTHAKMILLAETMVGSSLLASVLEDDERVNLRVQAGSEFTIAAETTRSAETRGYIEFAPESQIAEILDTESRIQGLFGVRSIRSHAATHQLFQGHTESEGATIEQAIADHIDQSFQLNSKIKVQCWMHEGQLCAYGFILFELPNLKPQISEQLTRYFEALPSLKVLVSEGADPDLLCTKLIPNQTRPIKSLQPTWGCKCSQSSVEAMLLKLDPQDLSEMAADPQPAKVMCHYCSKEYTVENRRLEELYASSLIASPKGTH